MMRIRAFQRTIGIDYSGARTPTAELLGLQVYCADGDDLPQIVHPRDGDAPGNWTRRGIAQWLIRELRNTSTPTLVGIDHAFSLPIAYFRHHNLDEGDWGQFLDDFQHFWPTDEENQTVHALRNNNGRQGESTWFRLTDRHARGAKSVFQFHGKGVAYSTHAGIPQLRYIRGKLGKNIHFWPFDGWDIPDGKSAIAEVYPALWSHRFTNENNNRNGDQHDAYSVAAWLAHANQNGFLAEYLRPTQVQEDLDLGMLEGWILGALGLIQ